MFIEHVPALDKKFIENNGDFEDYSSFTLNLDEAKELVSKLLNAIKIFESK